MKRYVKAWLIFHSILNYFWYLDPPPPDHCPSLSHPCPTAANSHLTGPNSAVGLVKLFAFLGQVLFAGHGFCAQIQYRAQANHAFFPPQLTDFFLPLIFGSSWRFLLQLWLSDDELIIAFACQSRHAMFHDNHLFGMHAIFNTYLFLCKSFRIAKLLIIFCRNHK